MTGWLIRLSNFVTRLRRPRVAPGELLLLIPHCLQLQSCERNVRGDIDNCARCGKCPIDGILALRDRYGIRVELVSGGRKAVAAAKSKQIRAVVAVACSKELAAGLKAVFPKATLAITNELPEGPCVNTTVDLDRVEHEVRKLLGG
jgi:hypothetical protein